MLILFLVWRHGEREGGMRVKEVRGNGEWDHRLWQNLWNVYKCLLVCVCVSVKETNRLVIISFKLMMMYYHVLLVEVVGSRM